MGKIMPKTKTCLRCCETLPATKRFFTLRTGSSYSFLPWCMVCKAAYDRGKRAEKKESRLGIKQAFKIHNSRCAK
jgi:hypothetical protein